LVIFGCFLLFDDRFNIANLKDGFIEVGVEVGFIDIVGEDVGNMVK